MNQRSKRHMSITGMSFTVVLIFWLLAGIYFYVSFTNNKNEKLASATPNTNLTNETEKASLDGRVEEMISSMSPEEKAGQLLFVGFSGLQADYYITRMINLRHIGGVVYFDRNIETPVQVAKLTNQLQTMSQADGDLPLFVAVDQEWGEINRFNKGLTVFPGPPQLGKLASSDVNLAAEDTAEELKAIGINVNFAPVVDIGGSNSVMSKRVYGNTPQLVSDMGAAAINGFKKGGVIPCAKHFPGLGKANFDPHNGPVEIKTDLAALVQEDLLPFTRAVQENVEMIMVANARYPSLDARNPACFSYTVQTVLLRKTLGYQGLILTDDLEMGAALAHDSVGNLAVKAVKAGADMVLVCHTPEKQKEAYDALLAAIKKHELSEQRLNQSLKRIITLKLKWDLENNSSVDLSKVQTRVNSAEHRKDAENIQKRLNAI